MVTRGSCHVAPKARRALTSHQHQEAGGRSWEQLCVTGKLLGERPCRPRACRSPPGPRSKPRVALPPCRGAVLLPFCSFPC